MGGWWAGHPETTLLQTSSSRYSTRQQRFTSDCFIVIALDGDAKAYSFQRANDEGAVNDRIGPYAVMAVADAETESVHNFLRTAANQELEFTLRDESLADVQTGSKWNLDKGIAVDGPLLGEVLQRIPYTTTYEWAWEDFYPHTEFYGTGQVIAYRAV